MKLSTLSITLALLVLASSVSCEEDVAEEIENEVAKELEKTVDSAAETVCQAFPVQESNQADKQPTKRGGFFKNLWKGIKKVALGAAVSAVIGKRDKKAWKFTNATAPEWRKHWRNHWWKNRTELVKNARELLDELPATTCEPEYQSQIEKLEKAIEVLGTMTHLVQSLRKCNAPDNIDNKLQ